MTILKTLELYTLGKPLHVNYILVVLLSAFPGGPDGKESACNVGHLGLIPVLGRSPGEGMATHPGTLAWRMPWTEEPGGSQAMGRTESDTTEH